MECINLNNVAASLLSSGDQETSLVYFQKALETLRESVRSDMDCWDQHSFRGIKNVDDIHMPSLSIAAMHDGGKFAKAAATVEHAFEFYDRAFLVSAMEGSVCPSQGKRLHNMLLAVISKLIS